MPTEISGSTGVNKIQDGTIVNADINSSAAIAGSKISGSFGKVLQVVNAVQATEVTSNSSTYADTGLSLAITPSSTSSKVLVICSNDCQKEGADTWTNIRCYRDSTEIGGTIIGRKANNTDDTGTSQSVFSFTVLDSPSSTSAVTYKTQFNNNGGSGTIRINSGSGSSTMCLMEIGA